MGPLLLSLPFWVLLLRADWTIVHFVIGSAAIQTEIVGPSVFLLGGG